MQAPSPALRLLRWFAKAMGIDEGELAAEKKRGETATAPARNALRKSRLFFLGDAVMNETVNPVRDGLSLVLIPLAERDPLREHAKRTNSVEKMKECVDPVLERCRLFQKSCPPYFPESRQLAPFIRALEECSIIPTHSEADKQAFIMKADECLTKLRSEIETLLKTSAGF